jgi:hypothetical protein
MGLAPRCGVFRLPHFDQARWLQTSLYEQTDPVRFGREIELLTKSILSDAYQLFGALEAPIIHGISTNQGDELTVTFDEDAQCYTGLHLDSWEGGSFEAREQSRTRLCINFGPGERFLLYVPLTLRQVLFCLPTDIRAECSDDTRVMISEFFRRYPRAPVVRLSVLPGYGYFADTDNMIHDGSTTSVSLGNTHFTLRGRFKVLDYLEPPR